MRPSPTDPLTAILAPAATVLTCTQPEPGPPAPPGSGPHRASSRGGQAPKDPLAHPTQQSMAAPASRHSPARLRQRPGGSPHSAEEESAGIAVGFSGRQTSIEIRTHQFQEALGRPVVDLRQLRALAIHGVPDRKALRALTWKLLLNYLPPERALWEGVLQSKRAAYAVFCKELILDPKEQRRAAVGDHPLSQRTDSQWAAYFKDAEMLEQIERDVMRTHPDMHFFSGDDAPAHAHREEMKRALFVFAKLNPGLRYVQGMNELLAPLYHQFATDPAGSAHAEADAFHCFVDLIAEFRDHFCQQLDNSRVGIRATLSRLSDLLQAADPELWRHLQLTNKVNPQFYAFRWITLLLTQEFSFPDSVRLWDTLFSDGGGRGDCLMRCCCAMLLNVREELLRGDFSHNLKLLQSYPPVDVHAILSRAASL